MFVRFAMCAVFAVFLSRASDSIGKCSAQEASEECRRVGGKRPKTESETILLQLRTQKSVAAVSTTPIAFHAPSPVGTTKEVAEEQAAGSRFHEDDETENSDVDPLEV